MHDANSTAPFHPPKNNGHSHEYRTLLGLMLIGTGVLVFLEQYLHTGWLIYMALPGIGLALFALSLRYQKIRFIIPGALLAGFGMGLYLFTSTALQPAWPQRLGAFLLSFGAGWVLIWLASLILSRRTAWWSLIPASLLMSSGAVFCFTQSVWYDFVVYTLTSLGMVFLLWGICQRLLGLIIPGCILVSTGAGIYLAWSAAAEPNSLSRVGIMLVYFALGWGLITVISRMVLSKFIWWPLIPGGILAVAGWGLYSGGNPDNAAAFISNTGSIALIILGFYLLLMRRGMRQ